MAKGFHNQRVYEALQKHEFKNLDTPWLTKQADPVFIYGNYHGLLAVVLRGDIICLTDNWTIAYATRKALCEASIPPPAPVGDGSWMDHLERKD